jgi:hypothetical protein
LLPVAACGGGLGKIWAAHDTDLNRDVALNEIKATTPTSPESWRRFLKVVVLDCCSAKVIGQGDESVPQSFEPSVEVVCLRDFT